MPLSDRGSWAERGPGPQRSVTERVADALPAYDVTSVLGHGGHAVVLAGRHRQLGRSVAIKVLSTAGPDGDGGGAGDGGAHGRFLAEARVLAGLDHPHIVGIYDYVESADLCLLVMERLAGGSARTLAAGGLTVGTVAAMGLATCAALRCAHEGGILHRDIKPDNILFTADGLLKVTDFGIAKLVGASGAAPSTFVGTPVYMAPEQFDGRPLGPACDLYALGVVLHELLSGRPPFPRSLPMTQLMDLHLRTPPPSLDTVPPAIAAVVARALAKNPTDRHPSAHALALDLATAATHALGPDWLARSPLPVRLDDDIRDAARAALPTPTPTPTPGPPPPSRPAGSDSGPDSDPGSVRAGGEVRLLPRAMPGDAAQEPSSLETRALERRQPDHPPPDTDPPAIPSGPGPAGPTLPGPGPGPGPGPAGPAGAGRSGGATAQGGRRWAGVLRRGAGGRAGRRGSGGDGGGGTLSVGRSFPPVAAAEGGLAALRVEYPYGVAAAPDGSVYVSQRLRHRVVRIGPDGRVVPVAGSGRGGGGGDGGPALDAELDNPCGLALAPDGTLFVADSFTHRVRRITPDGRIETVAGTGRTGPPPGPAPRHATHLDLAQPHGLCLDAHGRLLVTTLGGHQVIRIDPEGRAAPLAGVGTPGLSGDAGPAQLAQLRRPHAVAATSDTQPATGHVTDTVLVADTDNRLVRAIAADGTITTIAGMVYGASTEENAPAAIADIGRPHALAASPAGGLLLADPDAGRVRERTPDLRVRTFTTAATRPVGLATGPDGTIIIADLARHLLHRLGPPTPRP